MHLYANAVAGGWYPDQLPAGLGGSEEVLALWCRALARQGAEVTLYLNPPAGVACGVTADGVQVQPREAFDPRAPRDVLVTWKDARPWLLGARAVRCIHWSSDVEAPWPPGVLERLHAFVCLTPYHAGRLPWLPPARCRVIPHGIDLAALDAARAPREPGCALYASSPDRGLEQVLRDWHRIAERHPGLTLHVTYGWHQFEACAAALPPAQQAHRRAFRSRMEALLRRPGVVAHGALSAREMAALYWRAQYWLLPLALPDAELFCLNALKARHCGALPVIHRRGALADTVAAWLPYETFAAVPKAEWPPPCRAAGPVTPILDWDEVVRRYWIPLMKGEL